MNNAPDGISVTARAEINDYWDLGRTIANASSDNQADFLLGMQAGFVDMGGNSAIQMHYVADEMHRSGKDVHHLISRLNEYLGGQA